MNEFKRVYPEAFNSIEDLPISTGLDLLRLFGEISKLITEHFESKDGFQLFGPGERISILAETLRAFANDIEKNCLVLTSAQVATGETS